MIKPGTQLIAEERHRQAHAMRFTPEHDDQHDKGELAFAAACLVNDAAEETKHGPDFRPRQIPPMAWPFEFERWRPKSVLQRLVEAGALIAAEIDRLMRKGHALPMHTFGISETEHDLRQRIYVAGKELRDNDHEPEDVAALGRELIHLSGVCDNCGGDGEDSDGDGSREVCNPCDGFGYLRPRPPVAPRLLFVNYGNDEGLVDLSTGTLLAAVDRGPLHVPSDIPRFSISDGEVTDLIGDEEHNWSDLIAHLRLNYDWENKVLP